METLINFFQKPLVIKVILMGNIYLTFIYKSMKKHFYAGHREAALNSKGTVTSCKPQETANESSSLKKSVLFRELGSKSLEKNEKAFTICDKSIESRLMLRWNQFPEQFALVSVYKIISCSVLIWVLLKNVFPDLLILPLIDYFNTNPNIPNECYLFGRLAFDFTSLSNFMCALISFNLLMWRFAQIRLLHRPYALPYVQFMMQDDLEVSNYLSSLALSSKRKHQLTVAATDNKYARSGTSGMLHQLSTSSGSNQMLAGQSGFLSELMFYQVNYKSQVYLKLRPNRTLGARLKLKRMFAKYYITTLAALTCAAIVGGSLILVSIYFDWSYRLRYPNCDGGVVASGKSVTLHGAIGNITSSIHLDDDGWTFTWTWHRCVAFVFDVLENAIIWSDSSLSLTWTPALLILLNNDLLEYWRHLQARLELLVARVKSRATIRHVSAASKLEMEQSIYELQAQIIDFFKQIQQVDLLVSDHMTSFLLIWFSTFSLLTYHSIARTRQIQIPIIVHLTQFYNFFTITLVSLYLFRLNSRCLQSYRSICSLMAYDQSPHKRRFVKLIEFYTQTKHYTYTLFQQTPYTPTTYLSFIGWTFSCFFIIESLSKNARNQVAAGTSSTTTSLMSQISHHHTI